MIHMLYYISIALLLTFGHNNITPYFFLLLFYSEGKMLPAVPLEEVGLAGVGVLDLIPGDTGGNKALNVEQLSALLDEGRPPKDGVHDDAVGTTKAAHNEKFGSSRGIEGHEDPLAVDANGKALEQEEGTCLYNKTYKHIGPYLAVLLRLAPRHLSWTHDVSTS